MTVFALLLLRLALGQLMVVRAIDRLVDGEGAGPPRSRTIRPRRCRFSMSHENGPHRRPP